MGKQPYKTKKSIPPIQFAHLSRLGVYGLALILSLLDLVLIDRLALPHIFALHLMVAIAIANTSIQKKNRICWQSDLFSVCLGGSMIALILLRSLMPSGYHPHLSLLVFGIGLMLMVSGRKQLDVYKDEIIVLGILALYPVYSRILISLNWPLLTAKAATIALNLVAIVARQEENRIILPTGRVEVYGSCAGIELAILLVMVVTLFRLQFSLNKKQIFYCYSTAIALAFVINSLRIALLAFTIAQHNRIAFDYWHGDSGGWVFSLLAIAVWGCGCWYSIVQPSLCVPSAKSK